LLRQSGGARISIPFPPAQVIGNVLKSFVRQDCHIGLLTAAQWMRHDRERYFRHSEGLALGGGQRSELIGHYGNSGDALLFERNGIVDTPRCA
jgi:hypothetical protein